MKRRLINYDTFSHMSKESVLNSEYELQEAANVMSKALGIDNLKLHGFTNETVLFETSDNSFIHASYKVNNDAVTFDNIEELVINEESEQEHCKGDRAALGGRVCEGRECAGPWDLRGRRQQAGHAASGVFGRACSLLDMGQHRQLHRFAVGGHRGKTSPSGRNR